LPMRIERSVLTGVLRIRGGEPSSPEQPGSFIVLADPCATFSS
jgi:hypothetical protein